jgi:apolipoprotein N-acyltransferase
VNPSLSFLDSRIGRTLAFLACGALMACSTPPMNVYPLAWVGLVGFYLLLRRDERPVEPGVRAGLQNAGRGALFGLVFGIGTNLVALRFVSATVTQFAQVPRFVGPLSVVVIAAFEGLRLAIAGGLHRLLQRAGAPRVLSFGAGLYAGTLMPTMIPWTIACGVCPWPVTVQLAEVVGERGVAFLIALESAFAGEAIARAAWGNRSCAPRPAYFAAGLLALSLLYGVVRIRQIDALRAAAPRASIGLVVAGIEATERWDPLKARDIVRRLTELTRKAETEPTDFVVWPEAAYPFTIEHMSRHAPRGDVAILQPGVRGPILTGAILTGPEGNYNSAVVCDSAGTLSEPYDKMHLMWFGESVPFEEEIPWLRKAFARGIGLRQGEKQVALRAATARVAVLNCLEDILPVAGREAMQVSPNLLVNLTNDAWFAGTAESSYHLLLSRLRAIETRRDLLRAANYGPTAWIDASGRIVSDISGDAPGILHAEPALLEAPITPYARWGEWPLIAALGMGLAISRALLARTASK